MHIKIDENLCVGCMACYCVCQYDAISLKRINGFIYPFINERECVDCGDCVGVCRNYHSSIEKNNIAEDIKACQLKENDQALINSTSGGFFYSLGKVVISEGGVVFGAGYNQQLQVCHFYVEHEEDLIKFSGSKYVQSNIGKSYLYVKQFINQGRKVLFSGTPCQIAGLYDFLGENSDNLITVDVICYGVASPMLLDKCLAYYKKKRHAGIVDYRFRDKSKYGWSHTTKIQYDNGAVQYNIYPGVDLFYRLWRNTEHCLRECCYTCPFIATERVADFTMGNYWGIEKISNKFNIDKGVSLVLLNDQKAKEIFRIIEKQLIVDDGTWNSVLAYQHGLQKRKIKNTFSEFYRDLSIYDIKRCADKYDRPSIIRKIIMCFPYKIQNLIYYPLKIKGQKKGGVRF